MKPIRKLFIANRAEIALRIVRTARDSGCDALHPGYGLLSEQREPELAAAVERARGEARRYFGAASLFAERCVERPRLWMWPHAQIAVMGAEQAANTLAEVKLRQLQRHGHTASAEAIAAIREPVLHSCQRDSDAYHSTSELWDDGILDPLDTRNALGMIIAASLNAPFGANLGYGVLRL